MTDRALTEEAVLAGLQDIRLPVDAPGGLLADFLLVIGLGLCLALCLGTVLRLFTSARQRARRPPTLAQQVDASKALPEEQRRIMLLHLLKTARPEAFATLSDRLYHPGGMPESTVLEAALTGHD
ncbi:hypothetical protein AAFO92_17520 [Roseovarius sp. CAU 1744]|uniref:hypothetical protein n=1 Tax=Roseovarius sp. CAU 1744 TaxID=3140368 RepID=UPI00325BB266